MTPNATHIHQQRGQEKQVESTYEAPPQTSQKYSETILQGIEVLYYVGVGMSQWNLGYKH